MYKFIALALAALLAVLWHSQVAGIILMVVVLAVFLTVMFQATTDTPRGGS